MFAIFGKFDGYVDFALVVQPTEGDDPRRRIEFVGYVGWESLAGVELASYTVLFPYC